MLFILWVDPFMSSWEALVRYGYGSKLQGTSLECGPALPPPPRGSPISQIISMLYFCPILWFNDPNARFGYVGDVGILAIGKDTKEITRMLQWELEDTLAWADRPQYRSTRTRLK